jgi:hypothetical protein
MNENARASTISIVIIFLNVTQERTPIVQASSKFWIEKGKQPKSPYQEWQKEIIKREQFYLITNNE